MKNKLLIFILLITYGLQAQLIEIDFQEKISESNLIVEGEVLTEQSFYNDSGTSIYTYYEINTFKIFKGNESNISNENRMYIIIPGGSIDDIELQVEPNLNLEVGDIATFLVKGNTVDASSIGITEAYLYEPIQNSQSRYSYNCDTGEVQGFFQTFPSIPSFYNLLETNTGQELIEIQVYTPCNIPAPLNPSAIVISGFSPASVPAGAREILTITGTGFGNTQGAQGVLFKQHSGPYYQKLTSATSFLSWSDTQIEVYVPPYAGTAKIAVGYSSSPVYSANALHVPYSETNIRNPNNSTGTYFQTRHIDDAGGAYVFKINDNFDSNTPALDAFLRAKESWTCETHMSWWIDPATTTIISPVLDNNNIITFDANMSSGVLGLCYTTFSHCGGERYVIEQDITFNPAVNWNYSISTPTSTQVDFESVALHELGHSRLLNHVIDPNKVMNSSASYGVENRNISNDERIGGLSINNRSSNIFNTICNQDAMVSTICPPVNPYTFIPDPVFEQRLIDDGYDFLPLDGQVLTDNINTISTLDLTSDLISDFTGIESFTSLTELLVGNPAAITLDVSHNTSLINFALINTTDVAVLDLSNLINLDIFFGDNNSGLTSVITDGSTSLREFTCNNCTPLTNVDVTTNTNLETFLTEHCSLTSIDFSANTSLLEISLRNNQLTSLDLSNSSSLIAINCSINDIVNLDFSQNPALDKVLVNENALTSFNMKNGNNTLIDGSLYNTLNNPDLYCIEVDNVAYSDTNWTMIDTQSYFSLDCNLGNSDFSANLVSFYPNPSNGIVYIKNNSSKNINSVIVYSVRGNKVFETNQNNIQSLDLKHLSNGMYFIKIFSESTSIIKKFIKF